MNKIKWLFFDIGSTLVDESECLKERFNIITNENNINKNEFAEKVLEYAKTNCHAIKPAARFYGAEIPEWNKDLECLYPDVENILSALSQKYRLGIIANQSLGTAKRLNDYGIGKYFDIIISSAEEGVEKPNQKIFELALKRANCDPNEAIMIGDRLDNDILPANIMGMTTIWVRQSFAKYQTPKKELEQPDYTINSISEITKIV